MLRIMSRRSLNHYQGKHRLFRRVEHWLHPRMDMVCGNSLAVIRDLLSEGVRPDRLRLIYNGIDAAGFLPDRRCTDHVYSLAHLIYKYTRAARAAPRHLYTFFLPKLSTRWTDLDSGGVSNT